MVVFMTIFLISTLCPPEGFLTCSLLNYWYLASRGLRYGGRHGLDRLYGGRHYFASQFGTLNRTQIMSETLVVTSGETSA